MFIEPHQIPEKIDLCIIGAGPAGLTVAAQFLNRGYTVLVLESGQAGFDAEAQMLNLGWAQGPLLDRHPFYLLHSRLRQFGGSQIAWGGWCTPLLDLDFRHRNWVPHSGWPITRQDLHPYLLRAAAICGVPPVAASPDTNKLGDSIALRRYVFAAREHTIGEIYRQSFAESQNILVQCGATVTGLEEDRARHRIARIHVRTAAGDTCAVSAGQIVMAAGGCENARLLLANGLGNDCTGRFFMEHPHVVVGSIRLPDRSRCADMFEHQNAVLGRSTMLALGLPESVQRDRGLLNATIQLWPMDSSDDIRLVLRAEQAPNPASRVTLGDEADDTKTSVARLHWALTEADWQSVCETTEIIGHELQIHANAEVDLFGIRGMAWPDMPANDDHYTAWGCHHIGTTRMSVDPAEGVVDADARVHGMTNLFVAGSSVFPTSGYANPTLPLIALSLRLAERVEHDMGTSKNP